VKRRDYLGDADVDGNTLLGVNFKAVHEYSLQAHDAVKELFLSFLISVLDGVMICVMR
jgi:hypothetical protein